MLINNIYLYLKTIFIPFTLQSQKQAKWRSKRSKKHEVQENEKRFHSETRWRWPSRSKTKEFSTSNSQKIVSCCTWAASPIRWSTTPWSFCSIRRSTASWPPCSIRWRGTTSPWSSPSTWWWGSTTAWPSPSTWRWGSTTAWSSPSTSWRPTTTRSTRIRWPTSSWSTPI